MKTNNSKREFEIPITYLQNNQNIAAYNQFVLLAEKSKKSNLVNSAIYYLLAAESKSRQGKDSRDEILAAGKQFLSIASTEVKHSSKTAFLCAAKCFLRIGEYELAKNAFSHSQTIKLPSNVVDRPILIIEDSKSMVIKLKNYLNALGYKTIHDFHSGHEGIVSCEKLLNLNQHPIILLDMGLPDITGDIVSEKLLELQIDLPIILITADEKSSERVKKTISDGASAFIQKPFHIDDLKKALDKVEIEEILLKKQ